MRRDDEALQRATDQMRRLSSATTALAAAHEYDALVCHTLPEIEAFDPAMADACRRAVLDLVAEKARRRYVPAT
jgi:hypothetical protein